MIEGLDLNWTVGYIGAKSVMDTPLARMALERGGSFRVGLEDWPNGTSNVEQIKRAKEIINAVGRPLVTGADAIKYLDIPFAATRPNKLRETCCVVSFTGIKGHGISQNSKTTVSLQVVSNNLNGTALIKSKRRM